MSDWTLHVRDASLNRIHQIDDFQSLDCVVRFNGVGTWLLEVPVAVADRFTFARGIVAQRDDTVITSGPITELRRVWTGDVDRLVVAGVDDNVWLDRRLALPEPDGHPYGTDEYDVRTGACETILKEYVDFNLGPSAPVVARRVTGLTVPATTGLGSAVTGRARFHNLIEFLRDLALSGGDLGFRVIQVGTALQFQVYAPEDKSAFAIFSQELGNLRGFEYSQKAAAKNYIICGGGGEGIARTIREGSDAASVADYGRIESFRDRRDTTDNAELDQAITEELGAGADRATLSISPVDTDALAYISDYTLGDKVTVVVDDTEIEDVIREVRLTYTPAGGEVITPVVGTPGADQPQALAAILGRIKAAFSRISNLERR